MFKTVHAMLLLVVSLSACPKGTQVETGVGVKVDPSHCTPTPSASGQGVSASDILLNCTSAEGTIKVVFPRKAWHELREADGGVDAGPGK